jgi:drug/metabolite transporter (DMT)-like permease
VVTGTMTLSALMLLPWALLDLPGSTPGIGPLAAVFVLGVFGTGVAFVIFYTLITTIGPAKASIVAYVAPVFAIVYGVTLLGESFTAGTAAGVALILLGSWLAAGEKKARPAAVMEAACPDEPRAGERREAA